MSRHYDYSEHSGTYSTRQLIGDTWKLLAPYKGKFWLATALRAIGDLAWLYPAYAFSQLVTLATNPSDTSSLRTIIVLLVSIFGVVIIRSTCNFLAKYIGFSLGSQINLDTITQGANHAFLLNMDWHEKDNTGNKFKRINNAGEGFSRILRIWYGSIIEIIINLFAINIIISTFDWRVSISLLLFLLTYFLISRRMTKRAINASRLVNEEDEVFSGLLFEALNNVRTVKVMSMIKAIADILDKSQKKLAQLIQRRIGWYQGRGAFTEGWAASFRVVGYTLIAYGIFEGRYDVSFLILFHTYFGSLTSAISELSNASIEIGIAKTSIARLHDMMQEPITIESNQGKRSFPKDWQTIHLQNVSFAYENNQVLNDISFDIKRGEKIGIVGLSGAGKSTIFKLLLKEREEFQGDILFDNTSIKQIRKKDYFDHVSVVLQDTEVFNLSLKENITITNTLEKKNKTLLQKAITTAHITELVEKLPQGLNTLIGEKGVKLSGGERQRVGIARAIFKDPEILLMDEATSHLDLESEEKIRDSLHKFFENVTAIVIAHRLTTIKAMDKIIVLEGGRIVEQGNFETLYAQRGRFYDLWEKQRL